MLGHIEKFRQSFTSPRKAEKSDTHQYIQHHDPDVLSKKDDGKGGFKDPYEDLTDVSVLALIAFLEGLLTEEQPVQKIENTNDLEVQSPSLPTYRPPADQAAAKAMSAYQTRSGGAPLASSKPATGTEKPTTMMDKAIAGLDQAEVRKTIADLQDLLSRKIDHIVLERGDGFLESIQNAIKKY